MADIVERLKDAENATHALFNHIFQDAREEIERLRAKIEQMEQQGPSEQDASVRKAWARFSHELHRSPDAPYPGMADAFEQHFSQSFTDREWRSEAATWAAAWKAAKRHCGQPAPSVPSGLHPLETVRFWADAYTHPGDDNLRGHGMVAALLREYAELRAALAAAPENKPCSINRALQMIAEDDV